jgi:glycosyltransferase involved in cell wall biosynthesis
MASLSSGYKKWQVESKELSVIIPALNEEAMIKACLKSAQGLNPLEIIVVDGGSNDRTREVARDAGAKVVQSQKGRGIQMNTGASLAKGEVLLFLHADTVIANEISSFCHPEFFGATLSEVGTTRSRGSYRDSGSMKMLKRPPQADQHDKMEIFDKYIGGFFRLKFDDNSFSTRLVELFANVRARILSLPYGDQAIFIKKDMFKKIGGFREYPFLEDIDIAMRIKKFGKLKYIPMKVVASSRRLKKGYLLSPIFVSLRNVIIALLFMLGVGPSRLVRLYK